MRVRDRESERHSDFEGPSVRGEHAGIVEAERWALTRLNRSVAATQRRTRSPRPQAVPPVKTPAGARTFTPDVATMRVIARLLVYLTRMQAHRTQVRTLTRFDAGLLVVSVVAGAFTVGWSLSNEVSRLPQMVIIVYGGLLFVLAGRGTILVFGRVRFSRAARLRRLTRRMGPRRAIDDFTLREIARLSSWRSRAARAGRPVLERRLEREAVAIDRLRRALSALTDQDLRWALEAEMGNQNLIQQTRYGRDLVGGIMANVWSFGCSAAAWSEQILERLTGLPLTAETASRVARQRHEERLTIFTARVHRAVATVLGDVR